MKRIEKIKKMLTAQKVMNGELIGLDFETLLKIGEDRVLGEPGRSNGGHVFGYECFIKTFLKDEKEIEEFRKDHTLTYFFINEKFTKIKKISFDALKNYSKYGNVNID